MGFRDWVADAPVASLSGEGGTLWLHKDRLEFLPKGKVKRVSAPLDGLVLSLESTEVLSKRVTLFRVGLLGPLALGLPKKSDGAQFLIVESDDVYWSLLIPRKKLEDARQFMREVRALGKSRG